MLYARQPATRRHYLPIVVTTVGLVASSATFAALGPFDKEATRSVSVMPVGPLEDPRELGFALGRELASPEPVGLNVAAIPAVDPALDWKPQPLRLETQNSRRQEKVVVARGDTLMNILLRSGVGRAEAHEAVTSLKAVYDPRRLKIGQMLNIEFSDDHLASSDSFSGLSINLDFHKDVRLNKLGDGQFDVDTVERPLVRESHFASARVENSLFVAGKRAGVPDGALLEMIRLFSWDVDFQRDVQPGDSFELVYRTLSDPVGQEVRLEHIEYAKVVTGGDELTVYRFEHDDGRIGYYDANGNSMRKWLMRTPIDGARMSSGFGKRRHPISGYNKMHKGIDFAAPTGTPIYAAGDGTVASIGRNGGYGKYIRIRHNGEYSTAYAHLNNYAKGLKRGDRVQQGEVIGYVGSTGRSTGPHLHYEILENGRQVNPMKIKTKKAVQLAGAELEAFRSQVSTIMASILANRQFTSNINSDARRLSE